MVREMDVDPLCYGKLPRAMDHPDHRPERTTNNSDLVTCSACLGVMAQQVEIALGNGIREYLEEKVRILMHGQLPQPSFLDLMLHEAMDHLGLEHEIPPTPSPDGQVMHARVHYKARDGVVRVVDIQLVATP